MSCEFENFDCKHLGTSQCNSCFTGERYVATKQKEIEKLGFSISFLVPMVGLEPTWFPA